MTGKLALQLGGKLNAINHLLKIKNLRSRLRTHRSQQVSHRDAYHMPVLIGSFV
jgi:hypothetical protein